MFENVRIAPSILSADFMHMESSIKDIERGGASWVHLDVMDGHFVPNITMGIPLLKQLKKVTKLPVDAHLMVSNPLVQIPWFIEAGADVIVAHTEAFASEEAIGEALALIHASDRQAGLALKPSTPIKTLKPFIEQLDLVLVMSVYPGFSGQSYVAGSEDRVSEVVRLATEAQVAPLIEVDGGIDADTVGRMAAAGADVFVAGNAVFAASDIGTAISAIADAAKEATAQLQRNGA